MASSRNTLNVSTSFTLEPSNDSSYFIPNFPSVNPIFHIPRPPALVKVPPPPPPLARKANGYDMKTLRKQVDELSKELEDKAFNQSLLYSQNEQLWMYIQDLINANKVNNDLMEEEVKKLSDSLKEAQKEKYKIAEQLVLARQSKQMLIELNKEFQNTQNSAEEIEKQRVEAEKALLNARTENSLLESELQTQVNQLSSVHYQLDELKYAAKEQQSMLLAEEFFLNNKTVLKAAYSRFKRGVQDRMRESRITRAMSTWYQRHLKQYILLLWKRFMTRRYIMHQNTRHRRKELLAVVVGKWKVYTVLEVLFKQSRRRHLLRRMYGEWRTATVEAREYRELVTKSDALQERQHLRKIFNGWKGTITFLAWDSMATQRLEAKGLQFWRKKLFSAWKKVTFVSNNLLYQRTRVVPMIVMKNRFMLWHKECQLKWRLRGHLLKSFFSNMRVRLLERGDKMALHQYAISIHVHRQRQHCIRTWLRFVRHRRRHRRHLHQCVYVNHSGSSSSRGVSSGVLGVSDASHLLVRRVSDKLKGRSRSSSGNYFTEGEDEAAAAAAADSRRVRPRHSSYELLRSLSTLSPYNLMSSSSSGRRRLLASVQSPRPLLQHASSVLVTSQPQSLYRLRTDRSLRSCLYHLMYMASVLKRQRLVNTLAMRTYLDQLAVNALRTWRTHILRDVRQRLRERRRLLKRCLWGWKAFQLIQRQDEQQKEAVLAFTDRVEKNRQHQLLQRWHQRCHLRRIHDNATKYLQNKTYYQHTRKAFVSWRNEYSRILFWRLKEIQIDFKNIAAIQQLQRVEVEDLEFKKVLADQNIQSLESKLSHLKEQLASRDAELLNKKLAISAKEEERKALTEALSKTEAALIDVEKDNQRLIIFENLQKETLERQYQMQLQCQLAASEILSNIEKESELLKYEVQTAREQSLLAERQAELEYERDKSTFDRLEQEAEEYHNKVVSRRMDLAALDREHQSMLVEYERVQQRLGDMHTGSEGSRLAAEAQLRSKESAVRVLQNKVGLTESRIAALQEIINENRHLQNRMHISEVQEAEQRELEELHRLQRQIESSSDGLLTSRTTDTLDDDLHRASHTTLVLDHIHVGHGAASAGGGGGHSDAYSSQSGFNTPDIMYQYHHRGVRSFPAAPLISVGSSSTAATAAAATAVKTASPSSGSKGGSVASTSPPTSGGKDRVLVRPSVTVSKPAAAAAGAGDAQSGRRKLSVTTDLPNTSLPTTRGNSPYRREAGGSSSSGSGVKGKVVSGSSRVSQTTAPGRLLSGNSRFRGSSPARGPAVAASVAATPVATHSAFASSSAAVKSESSPEHIFKLTSPGKISTSGPFSPAAYGSASADAYDVVSSSPPVGGSGSYEQQPLHLGSASRDSYPSPKDYHTLSSMSFDEEETKLRISELTNRIRDRAALPL